MIIKRFVFKKIIFTSLTFIMSLSVYADASVCNTDALLNIMSDNEMDKFKDKLCVHYFTNEFVPQELSTDVCHNIIINCRNTVLDYGHERFPGRDLGELISEDMIDFLENIQQVNLIEEQHGKEIGNVEFFRALKDSLSKEELAEIPMCPEMKEFSNITECLTYEGMSEDDASFLQNYANAGRIEALTNELSDIRDNSILRDGENISEEKKNELYRRIGALGKKINESIMHNGMKNIDYKNSDLLLEKLLPYASNLAGGFDGEVGAIKVVESFLPGYNLSGQKMSQKKAVAERQTDLILGYWWQMKVEMGQHPADELENFFKENPANAENLKDLLHKLRLKMAKEHAAEACSESSRKRQKEFNDQGGACSIMSKNRKSGKIKYQKFDDFVKSLSNLSDGLKDKFSTDKQDGLKVLYNNSIAQKICANKVEIMGPYQVNHVPPQKFQSDAWKNIKKDIQEELKSKQERSQSILTTYREENKKNHSNKTSTSIVNSEIKKISTASEMKAEVLANKAANKNEKAFETIKPKMDNLNPNLGNKNFNNYFGNSFGAVTNQPMKSAANENSSAKLERDIESRLKALDEQISNGRKNLANKDSNDDEKISKDRVNLDQLLKERSELQNSLQELVNGPSKKIKKAEVRSAEPVAEEDDQPIAVASERSTRKARDSKIVSSGSAESGTSGSSEVSAANSSESKSAAKNSSNTGLKNDFGLVLTKAGEPAADLNQIISNPSESDLIRLAEKANGEPFLINENGEVVRVLVKKDAKGKLIFEKVKLTNEQKKKLAVKKDTVRSIKEIGPAPIRKMELDKLMKETR